MRSAAHFRSAQLIAALLLSHYSAVVTVAESSATAPQPPSTAQHLHFDIEGMSCQSCVNSITEALRTTPGVADVVVTLEPQHADVTLKEVGAPSAEELVKIISDLGYTAKQSETAKQSQTAKQSETAK